LSIITSREKEKEFPNQKGSWPTGSKRYVGNWHGANCQMDGKGTLKFYDGSVFKGVMKNSAMHSGTLKFPSSSKHHISTVAKGEEQVIDAAGLSDLLNEKWAEFKGEFKNNLPHSGAATLRFANGNEYFGQFEEGMVNGAGQFLFAEPLLFNTYTTDNNNTQQSDSKKRRMIVSWFGEVQRNVLHGLVHLRFREQEELGYFMSVDKRCIMEFDEGKWVSSKFY